MATSTLRPIVSDDERAMWYICQPEPGIEGLNISNSETFVSGVPLLVGCTVAGTSVRFMDPDDGSALREITFAIDGDVIAYTPTKNVTTISIFANAGAVVSIVRRPDAEPQIRGFAANPSITVFNTTTALSGAGLTGVGYVLAVGGGGGGGGASWNANHNRYATGGGGGSGGLAVGRINTLQNETATVGAGGTLGGNSAAFSANVIATAAAGGAGGTSSIGSVTANGGAGGNGGQTGNSNAAGSGGAGGTPRGGTGGMGLFSQGVGTTLGGPGALSTAIGTASAVFSAASTSGGAGGGFFTGVVNVPNMSPAGTIGQGGSTSTPTFPTFTTVAATGAGSGGGGACTENQGASQGGGGAGRPGAVYVFRVS